MKTPVNIKGFARLDFDEIKKIGELTGFDIQKHADSNKRRSCACGPGGKYLVQDKRYYTLLLIKHIEDIQQSQPEEITPEVAHWLDRARVAAREYAEIERTMHSQLGKKDSR